MTNFAQQQKTNGLAIAALVTGIVGLSIFGIVFGHVALSQIKTRNEGGKGLAITGLVLGYVGSAGYLFWFLVLMGAAASSSGY